jgi:hypothetical protein
MKELTWFDKIINWFFTPKYDCKKNQHRWCYTLSESGIVYLDDSEVPEELWHCLDCGIKPK